MVILKAYEWLYGHSLSSAGIHLENFKGVDQWSGPNKETFNRFSRLISFNLQEYQIIPFLVIDEDKNNKVIELLNKQQAIIFGEKKFKMPKIWVHLWKENFERDCFSKELNTIEEIPKESKPDKALRLFELWKKFYDRDQGSPMTALLNRVQKISSLNHNPVNTKIESKNKNLLLEMLQCEGCVSGECNQHFV